MSYVCGQKVKVTRVVNGRKNTQIGTVMEFCQKRAIVRVKFPDSSRRVFAVQCVEKIKARAE